MTSQALDPARSTDQVGVGAGELKLGTAVLCLLVAHLLLWTALPLLIHADVPSDNLEQLAWSAHPAWGYEKHPPFPSWILYAFTRVLPATVPMTYVLGAIQIAMMLGAAWLLARQTVGVRAAHVSVLLITCISFYAIRVRYFNHNTALLVATAGSVYCLWHAVRSGRYRWWLALGVCWGIGMLSKYEMVVTIACNLAFLWTQRSRNTAALVRGTALAIGVSVALFVPHLMWVLTHGLPTVHYAEKFVGLDSSTRGRLRRLMVFTSDQVLRVAPLLLALGAWRPLAWAFGARVDSNDRSPPGRPAEVRPFLAIHAWGPLIIMNVLGLLMGLRLGMHWATAYLRMLPLWFVATRSGQRIVRASLPPLITGVVLAQASMVAAFVLHF